ncbi:hypothetical protein Patl1_16381 [Pistacia atlantica]|uniref:Uncharacterized protein n=1 Tax=Pistacia atlantica TaxID=434234 RepID=A0ACC1B5Y8_9ROSI|nr:hypothetical protein Patl1_16381 [Pistacia atlantica]
MTALPPPSMLFHYLQSWDSIWKLCALDSVKKMILYAMSHAIKDLEHQSSEPVGVKIYLAYLLEIPGLLSGTANEAQNSKHKKKKRRWRR